MKKGTLRLVAVMLTMVLFFTNTTFAKAAELEVVDNEELEVVEEEEVVTADSASESTAVNSIKALIDYSKLGDLTVGTTTVFTEMYGNAVTFETIDPAGADAFTGEIRWAIRALDGTDNILVGDSSVFSDGYYYYIDVTLTRKDGFAFSNNVNCIGQSKIEVLKDINTIITDATADTVTVEIYMGTAAIIASNIAKAKGNTVPPTPTPDPTPTPVETYYMVTFNSNGGNEKYQDKEVLEGTTVDVTSYVPTREEHKFEGWYTAIEGGELFTNNVVVYQNYDLYAHWSKVEKPSPTPDPTPSPIVDTYYYVRFNTNGGEELYSDVQVAAGSTLNIEKYKPTRKGYVFDAWYTAKTKGDKVDVELVVDKNYVLYARWNKEQVTPTPTPTPDPIPDPEPEPEPFSDVPKVQMLKATSISNNVIELSWNDVPDSAGFRVYRGSTLIATLYGNETLKWYDSNLTVGKVYKYRVLTLKYNNKGKITSSGKYSPWAFVAVGGTNMKKKVLYSNAACIELYESAFTIKKGKTKTINVKMVSPSVQDTKLLYQGYSKRVRFISDNPKIATVNASGKITAKKEGNTMIWAYTPNGLIAGVQVTVK